MTIPEITEKIMKAREVIDNKLRNLENVIQVSADLTNVIAELDFTIDRKLSEIALRPEMSGLPDNKIRTAWKIETANEVRLRSIAKGYKSTLKRLEYNLLK